jgi:hypothetical protein
MDIVTRRHAGLVGSAAAVTGSGTRQRRPATVDQKLLIFDRRAAYRHPKPPESSDSEGSGLIALILGRSRPRFRPPLHSWPGLHGSSEANVTSVLVRNGRPVDDVFEIDPSGSTREAAGSAAGNNLVLASAFNL